MSFLHVPGVTEKDRGNLRILDLQISEYPGHEVGALTLIAASLCVCAQNSTLKLRQLRNIQRQIIDVERFKVIFHILWVILIVHMCSRHEGKLWFYL
jgi:hypothetical protein